MVGIEPDLNSLIRRMSSPEDRHVHGGSCENLTQHTNAAALHAHS